MALHIFDSQIQGIFFVIIIIFAPLCTLAVVLRFIACRMARRKLGLEDWFALLALIIYLASSIVCAIALATLDGRDLIGMAVQDPDQFAMIRKVLYAALPLYTLQMLFSKLSIIALYFRIFGVCTAYARWIYFLGFIHVSWAIAMLVLQTIPCNPVEKFWRPFVPGWCFSQFVLVIPQEVINSIVDFALVALALFMIRSLHISRGTQWKLGGLFGLGAFIGVLGFVKIGLQYSPDDLYVYLSVGLWSMVQMAVAIFCCAAPVYRPLFPKIGFWTRLMSKTSSIRLHWSSREKSTGTTDVSSNISATQRNQQGGKSHCWVPLQEPNTSALSWPPSTHQSEFHAGIGSLETVNTSRPAVPRGSIQVQREIEVV